MSFIGNILWFLFGGIVNGMAWLPADCFWIILSELPLAIVSLILGGLWCLTIVGIPFGKQFFKIAKLALMPFGARVRK